MLQYLREVVSYPALILRHRTLVKNFFRRELLGRFRGSIVGVAWVLVHPLFLFITYYLVFGVFLQFRSLGSHPLHYPLYLFVGILTWTAFFETAMRATTVIVENGNLIQKVRFPAQLLPLHLAGVNLIVYTVGVLVYLAAALVTDWPFPGWSLLALPFVMLVQTVFALGLSLLLSAGYVFMRDLDQIFPIVGTLWFFASPVIWFPQMLQDRYEAFEPWMMCNPMHHLLAAHRSALGVTHHVPATGSFLDALAAAGLAAGPAALMFAVGLVFFRSVQHRFADEV